MLYIGIILGLLLLLAAVVARRWLFPPIPRTIASHEDAERLVHYYIQTTNRQLRRSAWMLTFVVPRLDLEDRRVVVRIGINYGGQGYPNYLGQFQQAWANARLMLRAKEKIAAAFAKRGLQANIDTFT
ncbi:MAG: hypothetical protein ACREOH_02185 [Candidatus Entotheonellia bacterium]